jgi:uracil-DNA glycosylase
MGKSDGTQDRQQNRRLLQREIEQLSPELVVLIGKHAAATVEKKTLREYCNLYFKVPFPTKRRSIAYKEEANRKYDELQGRWPVR